MIAPRLACLVALLVAGPQASYAACQQIKAESDILRIRVADPASTARLLGPWESLRSEQGKTVEDADVDFPFVRITRVPWVSQARAWDAKAWAHADHYVRATWSLPRGRARG